MPNENYRHNYLYIGDKASASNVAFLKRYGITHVLNAAEGIEEGLVDLNPDHYAGTGISYLGFPLWDAPGNLPYTVRQNWEFQLEIIEEETKPDA